MKYVITSRHSEDVGLGSPLHRGDEFDDEDVPDHMKDRLKVMVEEGVAMEKSEQDEGGE
jgi:hypothetical protein